MALDDASQRYLASQSHGRLATVGPDGHPQNKPVGFHYNADLGTIDISGTGMEASAKYRNVGARPDVAFVVDDVVSEGAAGVRFVEIRGPAERVTVEPPPAGLSRHIIRIHPRRLVSWNIDPDHPGLQTRDLAAVPAEHEPARPALGSGDAGTQEAIGAVAHLVEELQAGWDEHDAEVSNRHFADDVAWGSPSVRPWTVMTSCTPSTSGSSSKEEADLRRATRPCGSCPSSERRDRPRPAYRARSRWPATGAYPGHHRPLLRDGALRLGQAQRNLVAGRRPEHARASSP